MKQKKSSKIALCGTISALSVVMMFLTSLFPMATLALPALAGFILFIVVIELDVRWATTCYAAISLLSIFLSPDLSATLFFILFFGYYPIVKSLLEGKFSGKGFFIQWVPKLIVFNVAFALIAGASFLFINGEVMELLKEYSIPVLIGAWVVANGIFLLYDVACSRVISMYVHWFRPKYLRKL